MRSSIEKLRRKRKGLCAAVIVAAGNASRMEGVDKIMAEVGGVPVIARTLDAFERCDQIGEIVVVTRDDLIVPIGGLCQARGYTKVTKIVRGGADRSRSVQNGLAEISRDAALIAIHDGARPFVSQRVLKETVKAAEKSGAAAPAVPVTDTVKTAQDGLTTSTPDRETLFAVQTPQIFDADLIRGALWRCLEKGIALTDDCSAVEQIGKPVSLTQGSPENIKITTQLDLRLGEAIAEWQDAD